MSLTSQQKFAASLNKGNVQMAKTRDEVIMMIKEYVAELRKNDFDIDSAILFGSYAKGDYNDWSDIDVALVSNNFSGNRFIDKEKIRKYNAQFDYMISPMPFRTSNFTKKDRFVNEILSTGIRII